MPRKLIDATSLPVRDLWLHGGDNGDEYAAYFSPDNAEQSTISSQDRKVRFNDYPLWSTL